MSLEYLVNTTAPTLPSAKNASLRVTVTVSSRWAGSVTFALGELDPGFGNHPAYLALAQDGRALPAPELVVPGDVDNARTVFGVNRITVAVQNPTPTTPPAGAVTIEDGPFTRTLSASRLAALPSRSLNVSFLAGTASQSHTEVGPTLADVLRAAHIRWDLNTWVAAVGSDGYVATVTPAEAFVGGVRWRSRSTRTARPWRSHASSSTATSRAGGTSRTWSTSSSGRGWRRIPGGEPGRGPARRRSDAGAARADSIERSPAPMSDRWMHLHTRWCTGCAVPEPRLQRGAGAHGRYFGGGCSAR